MKSVFSSGKLVRTWVLAVLGAVMVSQTILAAESMGRSDPSKPDTSRAARENAAQSIPFDKLTKDGQTKVSWALSNASLFRRLPVRVMQCDPEFYLFLVHHPDIVVNVWEVLGASHLTMRQVGPDVYQVTDDIGTAGSIQYLYRSQELNVAYIDGTYTGSLFNHQVRGRGIVILKSSYTQGSDGRSYVTSRLDSFLNIEPGGMEFLTKTFQPMVGKVADNNFLQTVGFVGSLSRTAEVNSPGMQRLARKLAKVSPEVRQQFAQLADQVSRRTARTALSGAPTEPGIPREEDIGDPKLAQRPLPIAPAVSGPTTGASPTP